MLPENRIFKQRRSIYLQNFIALCWDSKEGVMANCAWLDGPRYYFQLVMNQKAMCVRLGEWIHLQFRWRCWGDVTDGESLPIKVGVAERKEKASVSSYFTPYTEFMIHSTFKAFHSFLTGK